MRPIRLPWTCQRSGDCCAVGPVLTAAERDRLVAVVPTLATSRWSRVSATLVQLHGTPCPVYDPATRTCTAYAVRPYNCRRFACYRPDVTTEPLELGGPLGAYNASDRVRASRAVRRDYAVRQRRAQRWADAHGWESSTC